MTDQATNLRHHAEAVAAALPPLLVAAERIAATVAQGVHGRRQVGQGETFWQFRRYQPGDATTLIDWRQSAKSDRVYIRQLEWEAAQSVWIWCDSSTSMKWHSDKALPTKQVRASLLALALAVLLARGGERMALLGSSQAPAAGMAAVERMTMLLQSAVEEESPQGLPPEIPLPRFAHLVMIGDFLSPPEEIYKALEYHAARGVQGHLLQVLDPAEETLPYRGRVRFEGTEGEAPWLLSRVESVREQYARRLANHRDALAAIARQFGWTLSSHRSDRPPEPALLSLCMALTQNFGSARRA